MIANVESAIFLWKFLFVLRTMKLQEKYIEQLNVRRELKLKN